MYVAGRDNIKSHIPEYLRLKIQEFLKDSLIYVIEDVWRCNTDRNIVSWILIVFSTAHLTIILKQLPEF